MKNILILVFGFFGCAVNAQLNMPGIPYQAVVREVDGTAMSDTNVEVRFTLRNGDALNGLVVYQEQQALTTNNQGLMHATIGEGVVLNGNFQTIDWSILPKFLQVEFRQTGLGEYLEMGNQQLMSVPYALLSFKSEIAKKADNGIMRVSMIGDSLILENGNAIIVPGISVANFPDLVFGCTDASACNFMIEANQVDNSCLFVGSNCDDFNPATQNDSIGIDCLCKGINDAVQNLVIGQEYQGGKIAYIFQPNDIGYIQNEVHGIISATSDLSGNYVWGCLDQNVIGADEHGIGKGYQNTLDMLSSNCGDAAQACANLILNGYGDWFLPSQGELQQLYLNRLAIGEFVDWVYWSSTERSLGEAYNFYFYNGGYNTGGKYGTYLVRPIRYF